MLDIDHFKRINDTHGHEVGDYALRHVVEVLEAQARESDVVARMGGEEFALLLPHATGAQAVGVADRFRIAIGGSQITINNGTISVTVSIGTTALGIGEDVEEALTRADKALYQAKCTARDRVISGDSE